MPALAALTPAQVFTLAASGAGDSSGRIGRWTVDSLTAHATNAPTGMGYCPMAFEEAKLLLTGAGLAHATLTDLQYANANYAMAFSIAYKLLNIDATGASGLPAENFVTARQEYGQRVQALFDLAGKYYNAVGVALTANPYYNAVRYSGTFEQVGPQHVTTNYPYDSYSPRFGII